MGGSVIAPNNEQTLHVLVVGLGMVGIGFIEKLFKYHNDVANGSIKEIKVTVIGEEPTLAYNRVGLTQYFAHRSIEKLHLQPLEWYSSHQPGRLTYHVEDPVEHIDSDKHQVLTRKGSRIPYDICILATGSLPALPPYAPASRVEATSGVFVYRTINDLNRMMEYAVSKPIRRAAVIGGGLLGLEAAKALADMEGISQVTIIERNKWVLSRQLDKEASSLVLEQIKGLNIEVLLETVIEDLATTSEDGCTLLEGLKTKEGKLHTCDMVVFAIGITPRDELAAKSNIDVHVRGGFIVDDYLKTSAADIYAIGECAGWKGQTFGLIAPGIEMADVLAFNLTQGPLHAMRTMSTPDLSTKLKLLGINVASFGDYFADQKPCGLVDIPGQAKRPEKGKSGGNTIVRALCYRDPFSFVYKKYLFSADGKYLLGGMMLGDVGDYIKLLSIVKKRKPLEIPPGQLIMGVPRKEGESDGDDLDDDTQVCSCYNVSKGAISKCVSDGCNSFGELKSQTKISTGCGGCTPLATSIFNAEMKKAGHVITSHLCQHFKKSRQDLFMIVKIKRLTCFDDVMREAGERSTALGCEVCKPAVASILSSLINDLIIKPVHHQNQDTNDKYMANIQRDGTYSVIPRIPAGEITATKLKALAVIAEKRGLYTKITGAQRIDLLGANKQDLPDIWEELGAAGFESGHGYGKALRAVKSCVGSSWCRFGVGDSVGFAVELEERYKGVRAPHKFKGGVSGCVRECAEAQGKDFGVIATSKGWNVYVGGNGGAKPRHAELLATDVSRSKAIRLIDRFLMLYIQSADRLQRTARWVESLGEKGLNGLDYLKRVILEDSLGICKDLDEAMDALVGTYHDEWAEVVKSSAKRALFRQFSNTTDIQKGSEKMIERGQERPVDWPEEASPLKFDALSLGEATWAWRNVGKLADLNPTPQGSTSMVVKYSDTQLAIFRLANGNLYATQQLCPHRRAFVLSDGLIGDTSDGKPYVSCPMHKRNFTLEKGNCLNDDNYQIMTFDVKEIDGNIFLRLPDPELLDGTLGTTRWMVRQAKAESEGLGGKHIEIVGPVVPEPGHSGETSCEGVSCSSQKELEW